MVRRRRLVASLALALVLAVALAYVGTAVVIRTTVLDASTYTGALAEVDAYDRIYTEVLADPAFTRTVEDLLGHLDADPALAPHVAATTTNGLRWALPPDRVQAGTEVVVDALVGYLRGDRDEFRPELQVPELLERVDEAAATFVRTLLARAELVELPDAPSYRAALDRFVADLAAGRVPGSVPVPMGNALAPEVVVEAVLGATGLAEDPEVRAQVAAGVAAGAPEAVLATLATEAVRPYVERQVGQLSSRLDVVGEVADRARDGAGSAEVTLAGARQAAGWFGPRPMAVGVVVAVLALAGLVAVNVGRARRVALLVAVATAGAAVGLLALARFVADRLSEPLDAATGTGPGTWNLPGGVRSVLDDLAGALGREVRSGVLGVAGALGLVALAAGCVALAVHLARSSRRAATPTARPWRRRVPVLGAGTAAVVLLAGATGLTATSSGAVPAAACNGHVELCDRRYDEVAYAATHNSMSSPEVVKVWPEHDGDLRAQLDAGVRGLLIDTHYWRRVDGVADLVAAVDASSVPLPEPVARAVLDAAGSRAEARPGTFLCHNECIFGAQPFVDALVEVRRYLEDNPREVVTLIVQDAIDVEDTVAAFSAAGLDDLVYDQSDRWPTLGELIERDRRLVVFAEAQGGTPSWYADAWGAMQETRYEAGAPDELTCAADRGEPDASLFLLNHWVSRLTPSRADAAVVNRHDFLLDRARRCQRERGLLPNFLAVDFYNIGDVVAVVDELNGLPPG